MEEVASGDVAVAVSTAAEADSFPGEATVEATAAASVAAQDVAMHPTKVVGCGGLTIPCWTTG